MNLYTEINSDKIENFLEDGFLVLRNIVEENTLSILRDLTDRITNYADLNLDDPFLPYYLQHRSDQGVLYDLYQRHPEFQDIAKCKEVLDVLEKVIGRDIFLYENSLVYKPKHKENAVPWHQDFICRPDEPAKFVAWVALDNVDKSNGALRAIPGSHKLGYLPWHRVKGETHHDRIDSSLIDEESAIYLELNAGDILIFNAKLVHSSEKTKSDIPRRAYRVSYQGFESIATPRGTPIVLRGGSPESLANLYPDKFQPKQKKLVRRIINKIGKTLSGI